MAPDIKVDKMFHDIIANSPNGIIVTGEDFRIKYMNASVKKFLGIEPEACQGKLLHETLPELADLEQVERYICNVRVGGEFYHVVPFGMTDAEGASLRVYLILDIYESKILKSELSYHKELVTELEEIMEGSFDGILVTDADGKILYVNSSYERVAEIKREDMAGKSMRDLMNPVWMPNAVSYVVAEQKQAVSKRQIVKSGRHIIVTGNPIFNKKGEIKKIVINARDITEIYQLREELLKSRELEKTYLDSYNGLLNERNGRDGDGILAVSRPMQEAMALAEKVANFSATVLIQGESGVGKEEVAKHIHRAGLRRDKPFVTINCGAIPANLLESELFGYEKGAFTGAIQSGKEGLLEAADGGVAFLDEIGETPLDFQVKLLRFLESKEIRRVGSLHAKIADVRVIAATNRNLEKMVEEGAFREDLYYRLNVVQIKVPPLRHRAADIVPLAMYFLNRFNKKYGQNKILTYDVMKELERCQWAGNVRQLKNVMENMVVVSNNEYLQTEDLPWVTESSGNPVKKFILTTFDNEDLTLQEATDALERLILERAKQTCKTTREIADKLQVNQSTIVRKLQRYGL